MYYPDLSPAPTSNDSHEHYVPSYRYKSWENYDSILPVLMVGWLESPHPYTQGETSPGFLDALRNLCRDPEMSYMGYHVCDFCGACPRAASQSSKTGYIPLGSFNIQVIGQEAVYYAPGLILHYVEKHNYLPPQGFIDAVLSPAAPLASNPANLHRIELTEDDNPHEWHWLWPFNRIPNSDGLVEFVYIFRHERHARMVHDGYTRLGGTSTIGPANLEKWAQGKMPPNIGPLRPTGPGDRYPLLTSAFYLQTFEKQNDDDIDMRFTEAIWETSRELEKERVRDYLSSRPIPSQLTEEDITAYTESSAFYFTYHPDLSPWDDREAHSYRMRSWENYDSTLPLVHVGWLNASQPYTQGETSPEFVAALRTICPSPSRNTQIKIRGQNAVYYAPDVILSFVERHNYLPPQGFIDAVIATAGRTEKPAPDPRNLFRIEFKDDDPRDSALHWFWPVDRTPNAQGLVEYVYIFGDERHARIVHDELARQGRASTLGPANLESWMQGQVPSNIGKLGPTTPHDRLPRLEAAFYLQTFQEDHDDIMRNALMAAYQSCYEQRNNLLT